MRQNASAQIVFLIDSKIKDSYVAS